MLLIRVFPRYVFRLPCRCWLIRRARARAAAGHDEDGGHMLDDCRDAPPLMRHAAAAMLLPYAAAMMLMFSPARYAIFARC